MGKRAKHEFRCPVRSSVDSSIVYWQIFIMFQYPTDTVVHFLQKLDPSIIYFCTYPSHRYLVPDSLSHSTKARSTNRDTCRTHNLYRLQPACIHLLLHCFACSGLFRHWIYHNRLLDNQYHWSEKRKHTHTHIENTIQEMDWSSEKTPLNSPKF